MSNVFEVKCRLDNWFLRPHCNIVHNFSSLPFHNFVFACLNKVHCKEWFEGKQKACKFTEIILATYVWSWKCVPNELMAKAWGVGHVTLCVALLTRCDYSCHVLVFYWLLLLNFLPLAMCLCFHFCALYPYNVKNLLHQNFVKSLWK